MLPYVVLGVTLALAVVSGTMDRWHVGEATPQTSPMLAIASIPLILISGFGVMGVAIWALFVLKWLPVACIVFGCVVVFAVTFGRFFHSPRRNAEDEWAVPTGGRLLLNFVLKLATSSGTLFLAWVFYTHHQF
jgi:hypothetical protein